ELLCQFWPQFLDIDCQRVLDPLMNTACTSPAPPTLVTRTRLKYECPLIVNLMPPLLLQGTLQTTSREQTLCNLGDPLFFHYSVIECKTIDIQLD
ncbi:hypothetical protein U1Q18_042258, partial [Sarracenia purpurea var. burkii]